MLRYGLAASASVIALGSMPSVHAQTTAMPETAVQSDKLEEVVVTSRRRAEKLQDVPLTVSAFSAAKLESLSIVDKNTLSDFTPGLQFTDYSNGRADRGDFHFIVFRGLNVGANYSRSAASLTFLDGAPVIAGDVLIGDNVERIEVLKGPQNVYFGRSVMTGAINYVTKNPGNEYKGTIEVEAGNFNYYQVSGHLEGPIVENKLALAIDGLTTSKDGQYQSAQQPNTYLGGRKTQSIAGTFYATPTDDLSAKLFINRYAYDDGPSLGGTLPAASGVYNPAIPPLVPSATGYASTCNPGGPSGRVGGSPTGALIGNFYPCGAFGAIPSQYITDYVNYTAREATALSHPPGVPMIFGNDYCNKIGLCADTIATHLILNYELPDGIKLNEITAFHRRDVADMSGAVYENTANVKNPLYGNPAYPYAPPLYTSDYNISNRTQDYSTEFRASSADDQQLRWTIGANYVHLDEITQLMFYTDTGNLPAPYSPTRQLGGSFSDTTGVFGGLYYEPIEGLTFSAELRWQDDKLTTLGSQTTSHVFVADYYSRSPRAAVDYKITPDITVFGSYALGVRPGGFNAGLVNYPAGLVAEISAQTGAASVTYKQEKLTTFEVGVKGKFFDDKVFATVTGYWGKLRNEQTTSTALITDPLYVPNFGGRFDITGNGGQVDIDGVEADAQWKVTRILELSGSLAWNQTKIVESPYVFAAYAVTGNPYYDLGKSLTGYPTYSASLAADLRDGLTANLDWYAHADVSYKGKQFIDQENLSWVPATTLVNLNAGVENETYAVGGFVTNLTNNKNIVGAQVSSDPLSGSTNTLRFGLANLRAYGIKLKYKFNAGSMATETKAAAYVPPPVMAAAAPVAHSYQVFFDFNKSDLTPEAVKVVDQAAANAAPAKVTRIDVTGHTDTVGSDAYNMRLSRRRAESVAAELEARGIPSSEIAIFAKGKKDLLVPTADGVREPQNRRVQIVYEGGPTS
jgi:iron complex outermembrane receptor protein